MRVVRWVGALMLLSSAATFACGPLAAEAVFIVRAGGANADRMEMMPIGRWSTERGTVEPFYKLPDVKPLLEWMPQELYGDCHYKLYDSRGRFVRSLHVNKWSTRPEDEDRYILSGLPDMPASEEMFVATNLPVRETRLKPAQLTPEQKETVKAAILPELIATHESTGGVVPNPWRHDFEVATYLDDDQIISWWRRFPVRVIVAAKSGEMLTFDKFSSAGDKYAPENMIGFAVGPPTFLIDLDGDGFTEHLFELLYDGVSAYSFVSWRNGKWVASEPFQYAGS